ncbi:MAG: bifunctional phosphopantothenoylcysteine decarboxylase/phosphopantothenate--cysteine ligase CoaBC [Acidobacteria bacterium]|nr:bifunctional phosphopantothenoylcysteine decarboxylase/phosphopantothenate--cysteine ligase CoaBC [Acidobacteriota bacterium]
MKAALGVTGCIAAYKSIEIMRGLQKEGVSVEVVLTRAGAGFVSPLTFESLSGRNVIIDMFEPERNLDIHHISLAQSIDLLIVAPATANILGKFAHGIADDFLSTLYLATPAPVLIAPAMNEAMWRHPAVRANVEILRARGCGFVDPEQGILACGMQGEGRLASVDVIVSRALKTLRGAPGVDGRMTGLNVIITAGPTVEDIDPIRFISNRSSGKTGYAVAAAAARRGAKVFLVSGPTGLSAPAGVELIPVRTAAEMKDAVLSLYDKADIVVKAAAVADYRPVTAAAQKIKKGDDERTLTLERTDDILAILGKRKKKQFLAGFAAETENLLESARKKLREKNLDLIVANDVSHGVFGEDSSTVHFIVPDGEPVTLEARPKTEIAEKLLELILGKC